MRTAIVAAVAAVSAVMGLAACTSSTSTSPSSSHHAGPKVAGGTATLANFSAGPNYIFPLAPAQYFLSVNSSDLQNLLWRPLYWFGVGSTPSINYKLSVAKAPVYSNGDKTVTLTLNDYKWSDGTPVTSRDVIFWINLLKAEKLNWGDYTPGDFPDNVASVTAVNSTTVRLQLTKAYDTNWFTYNELSQITPLPQQAWDKTSASGKVGNYDETTAGAKQVYNYLASASKSIATYATNPLWQTVDGPWKLSAYTASNGNVSFVPNKAYTGPVKPTLAKFQEQTFTTTDAEFKALLSGAGPDIGYISPVQLKEQPALTKLGYAQTKAYSFEVGYDDLNFNNPTVGALFKQLYIRQVLQLMQDQKVNINDYYSGVGFTGCGPIPSQPANSFADAYSKSCPYAFNPAKAKALLAAHGWKVVPGGTSTCEKPGTAAGECGAGIAAGKALSFNFIYGSGGIAYPKTIAQQKSDGAKVGLTLNVTGLPSSTLYAQTQACKSSQKLCSWQISGAGGWIYAPDYYPTGEPLWQTGAGDNVGSYSDATADKLIEASTLPGNSQQTLDAYQDYLVKNLPVIWTDNTYGLDEVKTTLAGVTPINTFGNITPESWYFTK